MKGDNVMEHEYLRGKQDYRRSMPEEAVLKPIPVIQPAKQEPERVQNKEPVRQKKKVRRRQPRQRSNQGWTPSITLHRFLTFLVWSAIVSALWWAASKETGGIFPDQRWDLWAWVIAEIIMFYTEMTGIAQAWAERHCMFASKRG